MQIVYYAIEWHFLGSYKKRKLDKFDMSFIHSVFLQVDRQFGQHSQINSSY